MRKLLRLGIGLFLVAAAPAFGFPEMVRYGYTNCTTCHLSPNGGGVLSAYGRKLSEEVLSTWTREGEGGFVYGAVKTPEWLDLGGDFRAVQTYMDTPTFTDKRFIVMQGDFEAAARFLGKFTAVADVGHQYQPGPHSFADEWVYSRQHYLMYQYNNEISVRAGKFIKAEGLNVPDHIQVTKRGLGFDEGTESYNLEASYIAEKYDLFVTGTIGQPENQSLKLEKGVMGRASYTLADTYKVGATYYYGVNDLAKRHLYGPYAILGFTKHCYFLGEAYLQNYYPYDVQAPSTFGFAVYGKLDYEVYQGIHVFGTEEFSRLDFSKPSTVINNHTLGVQWFPRPHFEFSASWQKSKSLAIGNFYSDFAWLYFHVYL